jgi:hypothetical protein
MTSLAQRKLSGSNRLSASGGARNAAMFACGGLFALSSGGNQP